MKTKVKVSSENTTDFFLCHGLKSMVTILAEPTALSNEIENF
jgi:hypothetical protein